MKLCCPYCLPPERPGKRSAVCCKKACRASAVVCRLTSRQLGLERVANRCRRGRLRRGRGAILFDFLALDLLGGGAIAQTDAARLRADLDDLEIVLLAGLERTGALERAGAGALHGGVAVVSALALFDFGVVAERFDVVAEFDERAESGDARNFALHDLADFVLL